MPRRRKDVNLGTCRLVGCPAPIVKAQSECVSEQRAAPRYPDGSIRLLPVPWDQGEIVERVFHVDEYCEAGHHASCERHFFPETKGVVDTPFVFEEMPRSFDSDRGGWHFDAS